MNKVSCLPFLLVPAISFADDCIPTPHRTTGTHYKPVTEQKQDVSTGVTVSGKILVAPDCTPLANARVAHWQAGENGRYQDRLRAYLMTDNAGRYSFETEWPNLGPPHIHFIISKDNYKTLETQWVGGQRTDTIEFDMTVEKEVNE